MLVLARKAGQRIAIDGDIEVEVLSIRGSTVRLGISAPKQVPIRREELQRTDGNKRPRQKEDESRSGAASELDSDVPGLSSTPTAS